MRFKAAAFALPQRSVGQQKHLGIEGRVLMETNIPEIACPHSDLSTQLHSSAAASASAGLATVVDMTTSVTAIKGFGIFHLLLSFIAGGLFFSTALAGLAAVTAVGKRNVQEILAIVRLILGKVWTIFSLGISETRKALRMDGKWNFKSAWKIFKEKLVETRQVAAEGVQAVRSQANFYAAAVGAPGLIPIQYLLDRLMPFSIAAAMKEALLDSLASLKNPQIRKIELVEFKSGSRAPQLSGSRVYELENAVALDLDMDWRSDTTIRLNIIPKVFGLKIPVAVRNISFKGCVRVQLTPLIEKSPGYGAILVSFPTVPEVDMDVKVAGGRISDVPWLKDELEEEIVKTIETDFLWPKRKVLPSAPGSLTRKQLEELSHETDPFRLAELNLGASQPMLKDYLDTKEPDRDKQSLKSLLKVLVKE